jgi:hypothetical protein
MLLNMPLPPWKNNKQCKKKLDNKAEN